MSEFLTVIMLAVFISLWSLGLRTLIEPGMPFNFILRYWTDYKDHGIQRIMNRQNERIQKKLEENETIFWEVIKYGIDPDEAKRRQKVLITQIEKIKKWVPKRVFLGRVWLNAMKPLIVCAPCMSSVHGISILCIHHTISDLQKGSFINIMALPMAVFMSYYASIIFNHEKSTNK